jgi:uncharacterized membrane protein
MILGVFTSSDGASAVRDVLRESERRKVIGIVRLALIKRDQEGKLDLLEARNRGNGLDDPSGSFAAILRLMLGTAGQATSSARLHGLAESFAPGTSAIAALIEHRWVEDVRALMEEAGEETVMEALRTEIEAALAEGRDLILTAGGADWRAMPPAALRSLAGYES